MKRPKLPRKRKKAFIKAEGKQKYSNTVMLAYATQESPCKFWKQVENIISVVNGCPIPFPTPLSYW